MSFIDIQDPARRDEIVRDYEKTLKEVQQRSLDEKSKGFEKEEQLKKVFKPITEATKESTKQITSEIKSSKKSDNTITQKIDYYLQDFNKSHLDKYFGIQLRDGKYRMGDQELKITNNDIHVEYEGNVYVFKDSPGLWRLIMMNKPVGYDEKELSDYKNLLHMTDVINVPLTYNSRDKPFKTSKFEFFKNNDMIQEEEEEEEEEEDKDENFFDVTEKGSGIQFLPGDISGLLQQLSLLLAENEAGNTSSTRNHIVAILDQLLKRGYLNQEQYNTSCKSIQR